jgi:hypothetical protein
LSRTRSFLSRRNGAGAIHDQAVVLGPLVACEVEDGRAVGAAQRWIATRDDELVAQRGGHGDCLARRRDDLALPDLIHAFLAPALGDANHQAPF